MLGLLTYSEEKKNEKAMSKFSDNPRLRQKNKRDLLQDWGGKKRAAAPCLGKEGQFVTKPEGGRWRAARC